MVLQRVAGSGQKRIVKIGPAQDSTLEVAEHNLPATVTDHFTEFVQKAFSDSHAAANFQCKRTKTTLIIKRSLAKSFTDPVIERFKAGPFSFMIDDSNDRNTEKRLIILAKMFEKWNGTRNRILDMPSVSGGTAEELFTVVVNPENRHLYINPKGSYSVSVQEVCDANNYIINVYANYPGSTHDSFIFANSRLQLRLRDLLIGDNGYPLKRWLLTLLLNPTTPAEQSYNRTFKCARTVIEQTFGILKM
ncbi:UNVERIFIED_CONTAM: hypothetical protein FKN15_030988 [Acipenser sinensis]